VRLDKLPAVDLPRQEHSMNAISDPVKEPDHSSRLWSRELKSEHQHSTAQRAGGGAHQLGLRWFANKVTQRVSVQLSEYSAEASLR